MSRETILVTGSAGFIGFHVSKEILAAGHRVVGVDCFNDYYPVAIKEARSAELRKNPDFIERRIDLCDAKALNEIFKDLKPDRICNLAAQAGVRYSLINPLAYEKSNAEAFLNILEAARHNNVKRVVFASSSSVYGGNTKLPFSETDRVDNPLSLYAATKKYNELMAHSYTHLFGLQTVGLRFFNAYGPWGRPDAAMWLFVEAIRAGRKIKVFNHGKMRRDFTYVEDIAKGVLSAIFTEGLDKNEIINLGNHRSEELMSVIEIIENELGMKAEKEMLPMQPGDIPESYADIERARKKLGFEPKTNVSVGVPNFVRWLSAHPELAKVAAGSR
jgi:UDP-glucuronate 4-epimerase